MAAPLSTSCLQRWTLLQEAAQCSGVLERRAGEGTAGTGQAGQGPPGPHRVEPHGLMAWFLVPRCLSAGALPSGPAKRACQAAPSEPHDGRTARHGRSALTGRGKAVSVFGHNVKDPNVQTPQTGA